MAEIVGLSPIWQQSQFFDQAGGPLSYGKIWTYANGTNSSYPTFTDSTGTIQNNNPIVLDAAGRLQEEMWLIAGQFYEFALLQWDDYEFSRVRDVSVQRLVAGTNITLDPPSGVGPMTVINAVGSTGNPKGRGQSNIFIGNNVDGLFVTTNGGFFYAFNITDQTTPIGPADVTCAGGLFIFNTAGIYTVSMTINFTPTNGTSPTEWPLDQTSFGTMFNGHQSFHTRYSAVAGDGLDIKYQQASFTDVVQVVATAGQSMPFATYAANTNMFFQEFSNDMMITITRIG